MSKERLIIRCNGDDVSDDVDLRNGKANPFGWYVYDLFHFDQKIGTLYCGEPRDFIEGYSHEVVPFEGEVG